MEIFGYHGKILRVDLTGGTVKTEPIDQEFCRKYFGGAGFVNYFLHTEVPPSADALSPENKLVLANGPLSGLRFPGATRHCVGAISPLSGGVAKSESGGFWAAQLKGSGFDAVIVEGKSDQPVSLHIGDGRAELIPADHLWGASVKETVDSIRQTTGDKKTSVAAIGPGGENLVRYACIMFDLRDAAGRGGLGAVMGAKKLKAISVRGGSLPALADKTGIDDLRKWMNANLDRVAKLSEVGTTPGIARYAEIADLPVRNFQDTAFPEVDKITAYTLKETIGTGMDGCFACPVRCKKIVDFEGYDNAYGGPEYETIGAFGSNCDITDLKIISHAHALCNANGLDTISAGAVVAFAMECYEKGLLTPEQTDGLALNFGNGKAMLQLLERIAHRKGPLGEMLAEGCGRAAALIGPEAEPLAMQVKNVEIPMQGPLANPGGAVGYATGAEGPDHGNTLLEIVYSAYNTSPDLSPAKFSTLGWRETVPVNDLSAKKMGFLRIEKLKRYLINSLVICSMLPYSFEQLRKVLTAATGWDTTEMEMFWVAERIYTLAQLINARRGFTRAQDTLPDRFFEVIHDGPLKGEQPIKKDEFERAKQDFYFLMGWDTEGVPHPAKIAEMGIPAGAD